MLDKLLEKSGWPRDDYIETSPQLLKKVDMVGEMPKALLFGCSDYGVAPEQFLAANPGDLLVHLNAGNIIPPYEDGTNTVSIEADLEYAVRRMQVPHIIICGHTDCEFIKRLDIHVDTEIRSNLVQWLSNYVLPAQRIVDARNLTGEERHRAIVEQNILQQLNHLKTYSPVIEAVEVKQIKLHGWLYSSRQQLMSYYDWDKRKFITEEI